MKRPEFCLCFFYSIAMLLWCSFLVHADQLATEQLPLSFNSASTWHEFKPSRAFTALKNYNKWVLVSTITMKSKDALHLNNLTFKWDGAVLDNISASLYNKKIFEKQIIPIEDNLVADGVWNKKSQALSFPLHEKIVAVNTYYLVLCFPQRLESKLTNGKFIFCNGPDKIILSLNKR